MIDEGVASAQSRLHPLIDGLRGTMLRVSIYTPLLLVVAYFVVLYVYPISRLLLGSFLDPGLSLANYYRFFRSPVYLNRLVYTVRVAFGVALCCLVLGYPLAYLLTRVSSATRSLLMAMIIMPMWISVLVRTYAWMVLLGRAGVLNRVLQGIGITSQPVGLMYNTFAVFFGMVSMLLPYTVLPMYSVMDSIDGSLVKAASNLGATPFQSFRHIFFPLSLPGVASGGLLVFIIALGFYITPALLGGPGNLMIANLIDITVNRLLDWGFGAAQSVILLIVALAIFYVYNRYLGLDKLLGGVS